MSPIVEIDSSKIALKFSSSKIPCPPLYTAGMQAQGGAKITAMAFDKAGRRLLTGNSKGTVKIWNFSNGSCLKEMHPKGGNDEVTATPFTQSRHLVYGSCLENKKLGGGFNFLS